MASGKRQKKNSRYWEHSLTVLEWQVASGQWQARGADAKKSVKSYKDLLVWQKGILLVKKIYQLTQHFPEAEKFGLVSQMRRAAVSVPSNMAEGQCRRARREFIQFLSHAEGSVAELETQIIVSIELGYCTREATKEITDLTTELSKMLDSLRRKLEVME